MKAPVCIIILIATLFSPACKSSHKTAQTPLERQAAEIEKNIPGLDVIQTPEGLRLALNSDVLFEFDKFEVRDKMKKDLDRLADILKRYPDTHIEIRGYTDNTGTESHNLALSDNRARSVQKCLEMQGVTPSRMTAKGYGAASPKASNDAEAGRALNRRVEFFIR